MRSYKIIIGSKTYFERQTTADELLYTSFLEQVRLNDIMKKNEEISTMLPPDTLIVENNHYLAITEEAHGRIGSLIEDVTDGDASIVIHNPTNTLMDHLNRQDERGLVRLSVDRETLPKLENNQKLSDVLQAIKRKIIGQDKALHELTKSIWFLSKIDHSKPYVIMLYGESSIGKTETVRELSQELFDNHCLEKHLSMFQGGDYVSYLYGDHANRRSIGFDLLERESNLVFLDEFDKCPEYCLSAFYTLFDNTIFKDSAYDVDISNLIIILTSNYKSESEIRQQLGNPIYFRINKCIPYQNLSTEAINEITRLCSQDVSESLSSSLSAEELYSMAVTRILDSGENGRTIRQKIEEAAEDEIFKQIVDQKY